MIPVPEAVLAAVCAAFAIDPARLVFLGGGGEQSEGVVYTYPYQSVSRVLKIGALTAADTAGFLRLEERLKFVHFLAEHGVDIVYPLARADGSLYVRVAADGPGGEHIFVAYIMEKVGGSHPHADQWGAPFIRAFGKTIGRTHRISQLYPFGQCAVTDPLSGQPVLGWEQEWGDFYAWCEDQDVKQCWLEMREKLAALPTARDGFGFIHNDPHYDNLMVSADHHNPEASPRIVLLDFDVANYHWFVTDIAIALQKLLFTNGGMDRPLLNPAPLREFLDIFMEGYATENHLDTFWLGKIDLMISYRRMLLFTVMQGWIKKKPKLGAAWKHMILEDAPLLNR